MYGWLVFVIGCTHSLLEVRPGLVCAGTCIALRVVLGWATVLGLLYHHSQGAFWLKFWALGIVCPPVAVGAWAFFGGGQSNGDQTVLQPSQRTQSCAGIKLWSHATPLCKWCHCLLCLRQRVRLTVPAGHSGAHSLFPYPYTAVGILASLEGKMLTWHG